MTTPDDGSNGVTYVVEIARTDLEAYPEKETLLRLSLGLHWLQLAWKLHALANPKTFGAHSEGVNVWALTLTAGYIAEVLKVIRGKEKFTKSTPESDKLAQRLARWTAITKHLDGCDQPISPDRIAVVRDLVSGSHPLSPWLKTVRDQAGFHIDPKPFSKWLDKGSNDPIALIVSTSPNDMDLRHQAAADAQAAFTVCDAAAAAASEPDVEVLGAGISEIVLSVFFVLNAVVGGMVREAGGRVVARPRGLDNV